MYIYVCMYVSVNTDLNKSICWLFHVLAQFSFIGFPHGNRLLSSKGQYTSCLRSYQTNSRNFKKIFEIF